MGATIDLDVKKQPLKSVEKKTKNLTMDKKNHPRILRQSPGIRGGPPPPRLTQMRQSFYFGTVSYQTIDSC